MNSIVTAKALTDRKSFAGRRWYYDFRELTKVLKEDKCASVAQSLANRYYLITNSWDKEKNSQWVCRIYLSAKMLLSATLQISVRDYANSKNMRLVDSYLAYYSVLSLLRAIVFTLPEVDWQGGSIISLSHKRIINISVDHIANFDAKVAAEVKTAALQLRAARELISYWHPTSGDQIVQNEIDIVKLATLLAEIAQFNSEILERSVIKNGSRTEFEFLEKYIQQLSSRKLHDVQFFDDEDAYRLDYLRRKYPAPTNILHIMTEGHVESFFGAWVSDEENPNAFDPDASWGQIFDVP